MCYKIVQSLSYNRLYLFRYQVPAHAYSGIVLCDPGPASVVPSKLKTRWQGDVAEWLSVDP